MSSSIQADWDMRHFIANIQYNISKVVTFLNDFAHLNEKLTRLERQVDYLEAAVQNLAEASSEAKLTQSQPP